MNKQKIKLHLEELRITSFVTDINQSSGTLNILGGSETGAYKCNGPCVGSGASYCSNLEYCPPEPTLWCPPPTLGCGATNGGGESFCTEDTNCDIIVT